MKADKLLQINEEIRNIYNQKEITSFIDNLILDKNLDIIEHSHVIHWLKHNFRNFLFREQKSETVINPEITEDWMKKVQNKKFTLVILDSELHGKTSHIIDYFLYEKPGQDLTRVSYHDALSQSVSWTENQKEVLDDLTGITVEIEFEDKYSWVKLNTEQAIDYEGYQMSHCVAKNYKQEILDKKYTVYSLRDERNIPHVTLMLNEQNYIIEEIKGKSNHPVKINYQYYLVELLNDLQFYHIKNTEQDYIPNITFDKDSHEFVVLDSNHSNKRYNFYAHHEITLDKASSLKSTFNRPVNLDKSAFKSFMNTKFFHVSTRTINSNHLVDIKLLMSKNLFVKNFVTNTSFTNDSLVNDLNSLELRNNFCKKFILEHKKPDSIVLNLELKRAREVKFLTDSSVNTYFSKTNKKAFYFNVIDFSMNEDMNILQFENAHIKELKLPENVQKIILKDCIIDLIDFSKFSCETLVLENTYINTPIICKNLIYNNNVLKDNFSCETFVSQYDFSKNTLPDYKLLQIKNVFFKNYSKIDNLDLLNLSPNYFSPKSIFHLEEKYNPSELQIPSIDLKEFINDKYEKFSSFNYLISINKFNSTKFDDIHIIKDFFNDNLNFFVSSSFLKLSKNDISQIIIYEILRFSLKEVENEILENIFKNPISDNTLNHIYLTKENPIYATMESLKKIAHLNDADLIPNEQIVTNSLFLIQSRLKDIEEFLPYFKNIDKKPNFLVNDLENDFYNHNSLEVLEKLQNEIDSNKLQFRFPSYLFDKLYTHLNISDEQDFSQKYAQVMKYSFMSNDFRDFAINKFTSYDLIKLKKPEK